MKKKSVWKFTNKRELGKKEFIDYFERKVFRTIRKYNMLPKNFQSEGVRMKKSDYINAKVLVNVIQKKFKIKFSKNPDFSEDNLSDIAEETFANILRGNFSAKKPSGSVSIPLYFVSDEEIEIYAKLTGVSGKKKKRDAKSQKLFESFKKKNPDLEHNIVNAVNQI